jgi:hypothetical protein
MMSLIAEEGLGGRLSSAAALARAAAGMFTTSGNVMLTPVSLRGSAQSHARTKMHSNKGREGGGGRDGNKAA